MERKGKAYRRTGLGLSARISMTERRRTPARDPAPPSRGSRSSSPPTGFPEAAHASSTLDDLFREIHRIVGELMPATNFYIALYDAATDIVSFPYWVDEFDVSLPPKRGGRGLTEYVLRTGSRSSPTTTSTAC